MIRQGSWIRRRKRKDKKKESVWNFRNTQIERERENQAVTCERSRLGEIEEVGNNGQHDWSISSNLKMISKL